LVPTVPVTFKAVFEALSFGKCRPTHAEDALRRPAAINAYETGDVRMLLATKSIEPPRGRPFVLIAYARDTGPGGVEGLAGFRLYDDAALARDPSAAFAAFLDRYGTPYTSGGVRSKFSILLLEPRQPDGYVEFLSGERRSERGAVNALLNVKGEHIELAWPFVIDGDAYLADVKTV
ncbi:MAG: hypothetical protein ACRDQ2_19150, partial [Gaiellales bacterium]